MHGFALAILSLAFGADPIELLRGVEEIQTRQFAMPLNVDPDRENTINRLRLFVSRDHGKTWKHEKDYKPGDKQVTFEAERDGQYWFTLQIEFKNGRSEPAQVDALTPAMKVYVNSERRALKAQKSYEDLQREVEDLRKTVEDLQQKIKELEADRKRK